MGVKKVRIKLKNIVWRRRNAHNLTSMQNDFDINRVEVGIGTYGSLNILMHNKNNNLKIGSYCSIAPNVVFVVESDHRLDLVSTFPFKSKVFLEGEEAISKGDIVIEDDVWIGCGSIVLSGVHIGQGAVIAAGSVVTRDVPEYAIVGGVPAKVVKFRFPHEIIEKLKTLQFANLDAEKLRLVQDLLYTPVNNDTIDTIVSALTNI